ncbi:class I SAM-dependent methyltransferase [Pleurocapsa sp. PCC 7319]|uniref:class I SAM-dependent methyltransferase n=1 Tax=Pleurocapsa sp. PCC 7319 TaxID=118161 RepID=UPI000346A6D5|nr:class I SAM-dependent methyltransferase [Pleurocapsa sp. PCC 7319]
MQIYTDANNANWNDRAKCHHDSSEVGNLLAKLRNGQSTLKEIEINLLGDIKGKKVLHLMCHNGLDSISLALKGANVTAVDFSKESLNYAHEYAAMLNITNIEFILGDINSHLDSLDNKFDIVFMTYGVLCWLNDLRQVFTNAAKYLKNKGQLLLIDHHPFLDLLSYEDNKLKLAGQYFHDPIPEECICTTSYIGCGRLANPTTYQWSHDIGEIVRSLITSGLKIEHFQEYPYIHYERYPFLTKQEERYLLPKNMNKIPMLFSILASLNV